MKIDYQFIKKWEPEYDGIVSDQREYLDLVKYVRQDVHTYQSVRIETFERIINWKSPRAKGRIQWDDYNTYQRIFHLILNRQYLDKMKDLVTLPGIGAPIASTILHFIFPDDFPIYDYRTVEVLHYFGYLKSKTAIYNHYQEFRKIIIDMRSNLVHYNLRQIDRALFSFHKLNPEKFKKCNKQKNIIYNEIKDKAITKSIPEVVKNICEGLGIEGKMIKRKDIIQKAKEFGLNESSVLPADYCDNTQTGQWSKYSFLHSIGHGRYILTKFKYLNDK